MADEADLLLFHTQKYIEVLKASNEGSSAHGADQFGLGPGDNPVFRGVYDWSRLVTGASLQAARLVDSGESDIAFNISGGLHHAAASRASGFCYINDPVIVIKWLLKQGRKVAYIDIDAHHGDGVQEAFYDTDKVLTISIHETGRQLFPGTGFVDEMGKSAGKGYSVNVPLPAYADDELFYYALFPPSGEGNSPAAAFLALSNMSPIEEGSSASGIRGVKKLSFTFLPKSLSNIMFSQGYYPSGSGFASRPEVRDAPVHSGNVNLFFFIRILQSTSFLIVRPSITESLLQKNSMPINEALPCH